MVRSYLACRSAKLALALAAALTVSIAAPSAHAGSIILGSSGWEALWDASLDNFVDITVDAVTSNTVFIEKSAEFTQGPGPGGVFPAIPIVFRQLTANAVPRIVINDEIISNSTGFDWTDFHMELLDHGEVMFNPALTIASGFSTSPFTHQAFENDNSVFSVDGFGLGPNGTDAIVPNGGSWFPGLLGELYIDANPHSVAPFTLFTLKERPTPEPSTGLLLLASAMFCKRRQTER